MRPIVSALLAICFGPAMLTAQTQASYTSFGQACASRGAPPELTALQLPIIGREFIARVRNVQPNSMGVLVFGASNTTWGTTPLPVKIGLCDLRVSFDIPIYLATGNGTAFFVHRLPYDSSLVGARFYNQFIGPDPAGLATSSGATAVIGDCLCLPEQGVVEDFQTDTMLDKPASGGTWAGGASIPAQVGGSGRHGVFDHTLGTRHPTEPIYTWSTDSMLIPASHTETGFPETVTNGVFEFSSMTVPAGVRVRFVGNNPALIKVRGDVRIEGEILGDGEDTGSFNATTTKTGQPGASSGPGGGRGGQGGDSCPNNGASTNYDGRPGADLRLANGHAYAAQAAGTGGRGSLHFPRSGINTTFCALSNTFAAHTAAGGGGGGFITMGGDGACTLTPCQNAAYQGPGANTGGTALDLGALAVRNTGRDAALIHFAGGGSGGGGGGSHPLLTRRAPFDAWLPGSGGAGGGGVLAFRVGRDFTMTGGSMVSVRGGRGAIINGSVGGLFNVPAPGGGGSGGSILLQVAGAPQLNGVLDAGGGKGGILDNVSVGQPQLRVRSDGGDGADGYLRLEQPALPLPGQLGQTVPTAGATNVGVLTDTDTVVTTQSKIYGTGLDYTPYLLRYEIEAAVGTTQVVYSDDPTLTHPNFAGPASAGKPVQFRIQGAKIDLMSGKVLDQGPWRDNVRKGAANSLGSDDVNGWRWQLITNRTTATTIVVTKVTVWFQR